jgi:hypothetical protein
VLTRPGYDELARRAAAAMAAGRLDEAEQALARIVDLDPRAGRGFASS